MDHSKNIIEIYNKVALDYEDKFMKSTIYHHSYEKLLKHLKPKHTTVLDVACGPGNITKYLLNSNPNLKITGVDLAENMINLAKKNNPTAEFKILDSRKIDALKSTFDLIIFGFCFPYITQQDVISLLEKTALLLNKNGIVYMSTMEGNYLKDSSYKKSSDGKNQMYMYYHQEDYLIKTLEDNNFKILDKFKKGYIENDSITATDLFIIAKK